MLRMNALRERRKLALAGVKLEQQFQQQKRQLEVQREQEARMVIQAKARALREGKSFKNADRESSKLRQTRKSWVKKTIKINPQKSKENEQSYFKNLMESRFGIVIM